VRRGACEGRDCRIGLQVSGQGQLPTLQRTFGPRALASRRNQPGVRLELAPIVRLELAPMKSTMTTLFWVGEPGNDEND
jgi:hypothetical protein